MKSGKLLGKRKEEKQMKEKQINKVINLYNSMCCLIAEGDKEIINKTIDMLKEEVEKLKV